MSEPLVDTAVIIRLLTHDDEAKATTDQVLFQRVEAGELTLNAPDTVISDAVYVLSSRSLYRKPRDEVRALLTPILRLPGFNIRNRRILSEHLTYMPRRMWTSVMP
jgi:predicted nucleic-acid-binding protein